MRNELKIRVFNFSRLLFAGFLAITALGRLASAHVQTSGYIATDFVMPSDPMSIGFGVFELFVAAVIAFGRGRTLLVAATTYFAYLFVITLSYHAFWNVEPQLQFAQQILFFKSFLVALGTLGFGFAQSLIAERKA